MDSSSSSSSSAIAPSTFQDFGLSSEVLKSMDDMGFTQPTPIQEKAIPLLLAGAKDFIGLASTGTGKTAAFGIPLVEKINSSTKHTQGLVLSPTRELALQVADQLQKLGKHKGLRVVTIYGGASYRTQMEGLKKGAHIIVATPGRLVDFIEQKMIQLNHAQTLVLDEADEMISMGFKEDLEFILKATHSEESAASQRAACRTWLFSATMSRDIRRVADTYLENPETIEVAKTQSASELVEQIYYTVKDEHKNEVISRLLQIHHDFHGIIFCQTKMEVIELEDVLQKRGFKVASLHGDKQQKEREITLRKFRSGEARVLVATDVAARGLDVKELTHVVNHSLPWDVESYIHRIGRTGRAGQKGTAISLINPRQVSSLRRLQNVTRTQLKKGQIPTSDQVAVLRLERFMQQLTAVKSEGRKFQLALSMFQDLVKKDESGLLTLASPELLARVITALHPELLAEKDYDLDFMKGPLESRRPQGGRPVREGSTLSGGQRPAAGGTRREGFKREGFKHEGFKREGSKGDGFKREGFKKDRFHKGDRPQQGGDQEFYPRRDRGPRFEGFDFNSGESSSRPERKPRQEREERSGGGEEKSFRPRPARNDHPGIKRHRGNKDRFAARRRYED